ncbi:MAG: phosphate ABC transporter permease subunit PstC [Deltaproteobacteria bacterium]|nr:phosphate ABC transporter permease subunit PstC [Deltaproteobacteria bacterium]
MPNALRKVPKEELVRGVLLLCTLVSVLTTAGITIVLLKESALFFREVSIWEFLFGTRWSPLFEPSSFGVLPLLCGTFLVVAGSSIVGVPVGLACAVYLSEYASQRIRDWMKPVLEVLAGIPTVVYGYFALTFVTPMIRTIFPQAQIFNAASAAIVVGVMILPMIASMCDDALQSVPKALRDAAYALGATPMEVTTQVVVPSAMSGIIASIVLALSRAIGETMAVTIAAGATPKLTLNPLESIQTMTSYIVQVSLGDTPAGTTSYYTIFAVGAVLFFITLAMNLLANWIMLRVRKRHSNG